MEMSNTIGLCM